MEQRPSSERKCLALAVRCSFPGFFMLSSCFFSLLFIQHGCLSRSYTPRVLPIVIGGILKNSEGAPLLTCLLVAELAIFTSCGCSMNAPYFIAYDCFVMHLTLLQLYLLSGLARLRTTNPCVATFSLFVSGLPFTSCCW